MNLEVLVTCLFIILARVTDVSLGTMRTMYIVHGRRAIAFVLGFLEILVWVAVMARVVQELNQPVYAVSYALGFAIGNYAGITLEGWIGAGEQVIRIFTRAGAEIAEALRDMGYFVTRFEGSGREGPIDMLFIETERKKIGPVIEYIKEKDPGCFYIVDNVRLSSGSKVRYHRPTGWRAVTKKK